MLFAMFFVGIMLYLILIASPFLIAGIIFIAVGVREDKKSPPHKKKSSASFLTVGIILLVIAAAVLDPLIFFRLL